MKKHSVNKVAALPLHTILAAQKLSGTRKKEKHTAAVPPPDEETLLLLNKIAQQSPFCYYYKVGSNDLL